MCRVVKSNPMARNNFYTVRSNWPKLQHMEDVG